MAVPSPRLGDSSASPRSGWLIASLILHACFLFYIFSGKNPKEVASTSTVAKPTSVTSAARMEDLSEKMRKLQEDQLKEKVASLESTLEAMEELEEEKTQQLREAYPDLADAATATAAGELAETIEAQQQALDNIEAALAASDSDDAERLSEKRQAAIEDQLAAEQALAETAAAQSLANRSTDEVEKVVELQTVASLALANARLKTLQSQSDQQGIQRREQIATQSKKLIDQRDASVKRQEGEVAKRKTELQAKADQLEKLIVEQEEKAAAYAESKIELAKFAMQKQQANDKVAKVNSALQAIKKSSDKQQTANANRAVKEAKKAAQQQNRDEIKARKTNERLRMEADRAKNLSAHQVKIIEHAKSVVTHAEDHLKHVQKAAADARSHAKPHLEAMTQHQENSAGATAEAKTLLDEALLAQRQALEATQSLDLSAQAAAQESTSTQSTQATFERAGELEKKVAQRFKDIRAAELSLVHQTAPGAARQLIGVAVPKRAKLDSDALDKAARTKADFKQQLDALTQANQQAEAMDVFAKSLLDKALGIQHDTMKITLAERQANAAEERNRSAEDEGGAVSDMTSVMAKRSDSSRSDSQNTSGDAGDQEKYTQVEQKALTAPPLPREMAVAKPARRFANSPSGAATHWSAETAGWTFVDSWYILGPFDNAGRANIHKQFPPESLIDLDATYRSLASPTPIGWRFYQATKPKIEPRHLQGEYVIYYAWTQLCFEETTDVWIAVGSDDRSDLWINDVRVWSSSDVLKMWRIDEGMRRVRLEAGYNKVLYRIENGNGPWAFSLCLNFDN